MEAKVSLELGFQFLGIPPKGERDWCPFVAGPTREFPISRDPPEGGTRKAKAEVHLVLPVSNF